MPFISAWGYESYLDKIDCRLLTVHDLRVYVQKALKALETLNVKYCDNQKAENESTGQCYF